jgi:hypothetical protein
LKHRTLLVVIAITAFAGGCGSHDDWTLFAYPSGPSGSAIITPGFSRDMCLFAGREATQSRLYQPGVQQRVEAGEIGTPTFECGRRCRIEKGKTVAVCAETID